MNKNFLYLLHLALCINFIIQFLIYLHKCHYTKTRPIVMVNFTKRYVLYFLVGFCLVAVLFTEAFINLQTNLLISLIQFIWLYTTILALLMFEIRRRTMHPTCYILFSYLFLTTLLSFIGFFNDFYVMKNLNDIFTNRQKIIGLICLLHFIQLVLVSTNQFSFENSALQNNNPCPEEYSSIPSRILFMWLDSYIYSWYKYGITKASIFNLHYQCKADINTMNFRSALNAIFKLTNQSYTNSTKTYSRYSDVFRLTRVLFQVFCLKLIISWCAVVFHIIFSFSRPFILKYLLNFINVPETSLINGLTLAICFLITGIMSSVTQNFCFHLTSTTSLQVRSALISAILSKSVDINNEAKNTFTNAEIVNLMSSDTDKIVNTIAYSWILISSPFEIILIFAFLYNEIGYLASVGIFVLIITFSLNSNAMKWLQNYQTEEMEWKDKRIKAMTEVLNNIKIIKLYSWESLFFNMISETRKKEVNLIRLISLCSGIVNIIWDILPMSVLLTSLWAYVNICPNCTISAETIFVSVVLLNMLRSPMAVLPYGITVAMNGYVSIKRVSQFLIEPDEKQNFSEINEDGNNFIEIKDGFFAWNSDCEPLLQNINLKVIKGQLVGIIGKVASGKTSLLNAIIGEMCCLKGSVEIMGSLSYVPQNPWIRKMSTKNNIIFSKKYNEEFYKEVIKICALDFDFESMWKGEWKTGDKRMYSGGQKQRINLARAIYQKSNIYIFDDPLSALDSVVGKKIFDQVISNNGALSGTTRLMVTQNINILKDLDRIILLNENHSIAYDGDFSNINPDDINFMKIESRPVNSNNLTDLIERSIYTTNNNGFVNRNSSRINKLFNLSKNKKYKQYFLKDSIQLLSNNGLGTNLSNSINSSRSIKNSRLFPVILFNSCIRYADNSTGV